MTHLEDRWREKIAFHESEGASLERSWSKLPRALMIGLAVPWVGLFWSPLVFVLLLLTWYSVVGIAAWIIGVRRKETRDELAMARRELAALERD